MVLEDIEAILLGTHRANCNDKGTGKPKLVKGRGATATLRFASCLPFRILYQMPAAHGTRIAAAAASPIEMALDEAPSAPFLPGAIHDSGSDCQQSDNSGTD